MCIVGGEQSKPPDYYDKSRRSSVGCGGNWGWWGGHMFSHVHMEWDCNNMLTSQALAIAKPPPSNRMIFQGTESCAFFHDKRGTYGVFDAVEK